MKRTLFVLLSLLLALGVYACGDDDGPSGPGVTDTTQGVLFCQENAEQLAGAVVSALDTFPGLHGVYLLARATVASYVIPDGEPMPAEGYALGDLGLCSSGQAVGTWLDADDDQALSDGDTVTLDFMECSGEITGSLQMNFNSVSDAVTNLDLDLHLIS